jgi:multimeric flavodoxin WrbA
MAARILVIGTPIWLGHPASPCQVVLERLDALISEEGEDGRPVLWDKVAVLGVVGNEDGAHHVTAEVFQGLDDCGFTIPPGAAVYWVGEAMGSVDFKDLDEVPDKVRSMAVRAASNAAHLATTLRTSPYPPAG